MDCLVASLAMTFQIGPETSQNEGYRHIARD
jgi:hypothetical protein